jgi:hypothetical protein
VTNLSASELDEYLKKEMPLLYSDNGVKIGADIPMECFYIDTAKYRAEWSWRGKVFRVFDEKLYQKEIFNSSIDGGLDLFCQFDDRKKYIIHSSAEEVDVFIERLLSLRVFQ